MQTKTIAASVFGVLLLVIHPNAADRLSAQEVARDKKASFACMAYSKRRAGDQLTQIIVPRNSVSVMSAKSFEEFECERGNFGREKQLEFRELVCGMAAQEPEGMQRQLEKIIGERPAVLCGMAETVLGQWDSRENPQ